MIVVRRAEERGRADHGWLDSRHTFSFADYHDPAHMGFRALRVINEDRVAPENGFPPHPHRDMEIVSYVIAGELGHEDNMGNGSVIRPGEIQRMSAGTGVVHSEWNHSPSDEVHFLQIWILPERRGIAPSYEQKAVPPESVDDRLGLIASPEAGGGLVELHQDVRLYLARLARGTSVSQPLEIGRHAWVQVIGGAVRVDGTTLRAGDGAALSEEGEVRLAALEPAEVLLFDLA